MSLNDYISIRSSSVQGALSTKNNLDNSKSAQTLGAREVTRIELVDITEKEKGYGEQSLITLTSSFHQAKEDRGKYHEYALLLRHKINKDGDAVSTELEIRSQLIRRALQTILASYAYLNLDAVPIVIKKPYDALFHYRNELREYAASKERTIEENAHMKVLIDFIALNIGPTERIYEQMIPKGKVTFDLLWTLFRAEDDIIIQTDHYQEVKRVVHCEQKTKDEETFFEVQTWRWGFNGTKFGPADEVLILSEFSSSRQISQLPFFPVNQLSEPDQSKLHTNLVNRGRLWKEFIHPKHRQYKGPIWVDPPGEQAKGMAALVVEFEASRIMLDHQLHAQSNWRLADSLIGSSGLVLGAPKPSDVEDDFFSMFRRRNSPQSRQGPGKRCILNNVQCHEDTDEYRMTDEEAWLCPARTRGFSFSSKKWAFFLVEKIDKVDFKEDAFSLLELEPRIKWTIHALVEMHNSPLSVFDDFVAGKGKGVILSLEGPPGSGKTLTAESISELTHKPLYHIGGAELGSTASYAEISLRGIFKRAEAWDAILLLDEADLFLTKRTADDMERNAFVTVFLRCLEYYQGIMFLTTNRVEEYDPAFSSRIHLKVKFTAPDHCKRATIWRNLLKTVKACKNWDNAVYERLGKDLDLNGREIKNLIRPALAVAANKNELLTEDTLRLLYRMNHDKT